jgi:hypothetical protein
LSLQDNIPLFASDNLRFVIIPIKTAAIGPQENEAAIANPGCDSPSANSARRAAATATPEISRNSREAPKQRRENKQGTRKVVQQWSEWPNIVKMVSNPQALYPESGIKTHVCK